MSLRKAVLLISLVVLEGCAALHALEQETADKSFVCANGLDLGTAKSD